MTIEEFRSKINAGPTADELRIGFERHITDLANKAIDGRDDFKTMKKRIAELEDVIEKMQSTLNTLTGKVPEEPK